MDTLLVSSAFLWHLVQIHLNSFSNEKWPSRDIRQAIYKEKIFFQSEMNLIYSFTAFTCHLAARKSHKMKLANQLPLTPEPSVNCMSLMSRGKPFWVDPERQTHRDRALTTLCLCVQRPWNRRRACRKTLVKTLMCILALLLVTKITAVPKVSAIINNHLAPVTIWGSWESTVT